MISVVEGLIGEDGQHRLKSSGKFLLAGIGAKLVRKAALAWPPEDVAKRDRVSEVFHRGDAVRIAERPSASSAFARSSQCFVPAEFLLMDAVLLNLNFEAKKSPLGVDGGNFFGSHECNFLKMLADVKMHLEAIGIIHQT